VDAANLAEDISPSGVRADGQSEVSIAAASPYVVDLPSFALNVGIGTGWQKRGRGLRVAEIDGCGIEYVLLNRLTFYPIGGLTTASW